MKQIWVIAVMIAVFAAVGFSAGNKAQDRLNTMGIKKYQTKNNPSADISKIYLFNESGIKGGIIVLAYRDARMDLMVTIVSTNNGYIIKSAEANDDVAAKKNRRATEVLDYLKKLDGIKTDKAVDAATGATRYAKGMYIYIDSAVKQAVKLIDAQK